MHSTDYSNTLWVNVNLCLFDSFQELFISIENTKTAFYLKHTHLEELTGDLEECNTRVLLPCLIISETILNCIFYYFVLERFFLTYIFSSRSKYAEVPATRLQ